MKIAGLDIGTTGCKCTVFDQEGTYLGKAYRDYPVKRKVSGHEVDAASIMDGVYEVLSEMASQYPDIAGIGVTSFGEAFVMIDENGKPLHNAMLYTDPRGSEQCRRLADTIGEKRITEITGLRPHPMYSISKMMWIRENRPEVFKKAAAILLMEDYVVYHLTGKRQIDYSLAARTMAFDTVNLRWNQEILKAAGIPEEMLSRAVPVGGDAGCITKETSKKTGLSETTHIVSIGHDQMASAAGAGAFEPSLAVEGAGTTECITAVLDSIPDMEKAYQGYYAIAPYVVPGKYITYAFSNTGGALLQWCTDRFASKEKTLAKEEGISVNEYLERQYRLDALESGIEDPQQLPPTGLLVLPHFAGAGTPYMDVGSKGAILGLTTDTSVAEIYRGCMEGVVYEMYLNIRALESAGIRFTHINAVGGGAHSEEWMQMKADIMNVPITALKTVDAGTIGCAMLTGIAVGAFQDIKDAVTHMVDRSRTYYPRQKMHEAYMEVYQRYEKLYTAIRPLM